MRKRIALLLAIVMLAMTILAACGAQRGAGEEASGGEASGGEVAESDGEPSGGVVKSGEIEEELSSSNGEAGQHGLSDEPKAESLWSPPDGAATIPQGSIVIASASGDVYGDGYQSTVSIISTKEQLFPGYVSYDDLSLTISGNGREVAIPLDISRISCAYPDLFLGDFTGDGVADIFVKIPSIGSDHSPTLCFIYAHIDGKLIEIFDYDRVESTLAYKVARKDGYVTEVYSIAEDKLYAFEFSEQYKRHPEHYYVWDGSTDDAPMYDDHGQLNPGALVWEPEHTVMLDMAIYNEVTANTARDPHKTYRILLTQAIWGEATRRDYIGEVYSFLEWDSDSGMFVTGRQVFEPMEWTYG